MKLIKITHKQLKKPLYVNPFKIFYHYFSDNGLTTIVVSDNGAAVPVEESVDTVTERIEQAFTQMKGEQDAE